MTIGEKIRQLRKARNLTQKQLGELSGIAEPTIRRYELGKLNPKRETLTKIAEALGVHPIELSGEFFDSALLSLLKMNYSSDDEFREAFLSQKIAFAVLETENDRMLIRFYDMLNNRGKIEAACLVGDLTTKDEFLRDKYKKKPPQE